MSTHGSSWHQDREIRFAKRAKRLGRARARRPFKGMSKPAAMRLVEKYLGRMNPVLTNPRGHRGHKRKKRGGSLFHRTMRATNKRIRRIHGGYREKRDKNRFKVYREKRRINPKRKGARRTAYKHAKALRGRNRSMYSGKIRSSKQRRRWIKWEKALGEGFEPQTPRTVRWRVRRSR